LTDLDQTGGGSIAGPIDELGRAIDAYERVCIDDLIVGLQLATRSALDRLDRAIKILDRLARHRDSRPSPVGLSSLGSGSYPSRRSTS
jgi:hypothetical protein